MICHHLNLCRANKIRHNAWWNEENEIVRSINIRLAPLCDDPPPALVHKPLDDLEHLQSAGEATNNKKKSKGFKVIKTDPAVQAAFLYKYVRSLSSMNASILHCP